MNASEAKQVLIACRPGSDDLRSAEAMTALALVQHDPELRRWWELQQAFHEQARRSFGEIPVPAHLRGRIHARTKVIPLPWWRTRVAWSAAAALMLLAVVWFWPSPSAEDSFATFRSRTARSVLRQYNMDITTNDMAQIREFLDARQAPADYTLPPGLSRLPALGAGVLGWKDRKVAMVCLNGGVQGTLFLFIVDEKSLRDPPARREFAAVKELNTVSWSEQGKTYVLASSGGREWLEQLF